VVCCTDTVTTQTSLSSSWWFAQCKRHRAAAGGLLYRYSHNANVTEQQLVVCTMQMSPSSSWWFAVPIKSQRKRHRAAAGGLHNANVTEQQLVVCCTDTVTTQPASVVLLVASQYALLGYGNRQVWVRGPGWTDHCQVIATYALRLNSRAGTEGSTVSSLVCDRWLILGLETLSISRCLNH